MTGKWNLHFIKFELGLWFKWIYLLILFHGNDKYRNTEFIQQVLILVPHKELVKEIPFLVPSYHQVNI